MKCPTCGGPNVFHSHARSGVDRFLKRALPITFYRCHDCSWRRPRFRGGVKATLVYAASLVGYLGGIVLAVAVAAAIVYVALTFIGVQNPL